MSLEESALEVKKKQSDSLRENFKNQITAQKENLKKLQSDFEKMAFEDERPRLIETRGVLEKQLDELEANVGRQRMALEAELASLASEVSVLESKLIEGHRRGFQTLADAGETTNLTLDACSQELGQLEKTIELTKKYFSEQLASLESRGNEIAISMDHTRAVFESIIEERQKELLMAIEGLKLKKEAQEKKWRHEKDHLTELVAKTKKESEGLKTKIADEELNFNKTRQLKEEETNKTVAKEKQKIQALREALAHLESDGENKIKARSATLTGLEAKANAQPQELKKDWERDLIKWNEDQESLKRTIKENQEIFAREKAQFLKDNELLEHELVNIKKEHAQAAIFCQKELSQIDENHKESILKLQEQSRAISEEKSRAQVEMESQIKEFDSKIEVLSLEIEKRVQEHEKNKNVLRERYGTEIKEIKQELRGLQESAALAIKEYTARKTSLEEDLKSRRRDLEALKTDHAHKKSSMLAQWQKEKTLLEGEIEGFKQTIKAIDQTHEKIFRERTQALQQSSLELERIEASYKEEMSRLNVLCDQEKNHFEKNLKQAVTIRQHEVLALNQVCCELENKMNALAAETETAKAELTQEQLSIEQNSRNSRLELQAKRDSLAEELKNARRLYQEQVKEKEQELYLLRLKVDLRGRQFKETLDNKKKELVLYQKGLSQEMEDIYKTLAAELEAMGCRQKELLDQGKALESQKLSLNSELENLKAANSNYLVKDLDSMAKHAKEHLAHFIKRAEQILTSQEKERQKLLQFSEQLGVSKELRESLDDWTLSWDKELRTLSHFVRGLQERTRNWTIS